jgi:hypothetical protein
MKLGTKRGLDELGKVCRLGGGDAAGHRREVTVTSIIRR